MKFIIISLIFLGMNCNAQEATKTKKDSFNLYLKEHSKFQRRVGNTMLVMSGIFFTGSIAYWNFGEPEIPNVNSFPTLGQFNSATFSYQEKYDRYKINRVALSITTGFLFVTGSVLRASGRIRRDIYLNNQYSINLGLQENGVGVCFKF